MQNGGLFAPDRITELLLRSKHPSGDDEIKVPMTNTEPIVIVKDQVENQIRSMDVNTAGGPTQIRVFHLRIALDQEPSFARHFTALVNKLFR